VIQPGVVRLARVMAVALGERAVDQLREQLGVGALNEAAHQQASVTA